MKDQIPKTHILVTEMEEPTLRYLRSQVNTAVQIAVENPPTEDVVQEQIADLLAEDPEFGHWPLSNRRGEQTTYIEHLALKVMQALTRPVEREEGVDNDYIDPDIALPDTPQAPYTEVDGIEQDDMEDP